MNSIDRHASGTPVASLSDAAERYMRLALKAQAGCRATIETIHKLQRPHEQIVKHVHVSDGAQWPGSGRSLGQL